MTNRLLAVILFLFVALAASYAQQDIFVAGAGSSPYTTIATNANWSGTGPGTVSNNFIFQPVDPNEGFCLFVTNNNPTNAHNFSVSVSQTGDPSLRQFTGKTGQWFSVPTNLAFPVSVAANSTSGINYKTTASAGIVVTITGNSGAAGSPDTANIFAVQTTASACGSLPTNAVQGPFQQNSNVTNAQNFPVLVGGLQAPGVTSFAETAHIGTTGNGWLIDGGVCCQSWASGFVTPGNFASATFSKTMAAFGTQQQGEAVIDVLPMGSMGAKGWTVGFTRTNLLEAATDQNYLTQSGLLAFTVVGRFVNPPAGTTILHHFNKSSSSANPAYKTATISCSAACEVFVNKTTAQGNTCTALTIQNMQLGNNGVVQAPNANDIAENNCTVAAPTVGWQIFDIQLGAGATYQLDLSGFVNFHNAAGNGGGIDFIENTAVAAGNVAVTVQFMEQ